MPVKKVAQSGQVVFCDGLYEENEGLCYHCEMQSFDIQDKGHNSSHSRVFNSPLSLRMFIVCLYAS